MRKQIVIILILIISLYPLTARAGRPTPQPYPPPGAGAEMYPGPEPTVTLGSLPTAAAPTTRPHVWGLYSQISSNRWWVSWDTGYPFPDANGHVCITQGWGTPECLDLHFYYYDNALGRNWFYAESEVCGNWYVFYSNIEGESGTLPDYNDFWIKCIYLPDIHQNG